MSRVPLPRLHHQKREPVKRKLVMSYECSRCTRAWYEDYKEGQTLPDPPSVKALLQDGTSAATKVEFECLCSACEKVVKNHLAGIAKQIKGKSPERKAEAKKKPQDGASTEPTPPLVGTSRARSSAG